MAAHSILLVDDEAGILKSLQRLFAEEEYQIYTADGGERGLEILKGHSVDLVISDQKMPNMSGSEFLEKVFRQYPDTMRILLTGYSDMEAIISAINKGKIYQYIAKPWNNENLKITVKKALDQYELIRENKRLLQITQRQNEELKENNELLEERVSQRTQELDKLYKELKKNFVEFIRVFIYLMGGFDKQLGERCKRVAFMAKLIGQKLSLPEKELEQLEIAGLLHDIGWITIPKEIRSKSRPFLNAREQEMIKQHPLIGQATISTVQNLSEVGIIIRSHHENFDGGGYPDGLQGEKIPKLARILRVADEYDNLKKIKVGDKPISNERCFEYLKKYRGTLLDPNIVDYFFLVIRDNIAAKSKQKEICLSVDKLKPGMKISRMVKTINDAVALQPNTILQEEEIAGLASLKSTKVIEDRVYVYST